MVNALLLALPLLVVVGQEPAPEPVPANVDSSATDNGFQAEPGWRPLGKDLWFDPEAKQLILRARVCLREGYLEHLLCSKNSKEHESILATEAPPRLIHAGLLLTGAEPGATVQFVPEFQPPSGTSIQIEASWTDKAGQPQSVDARQWVRADDRDEVLGPLWVFAGSSLFPHPQTGEMIYAAESGDLITVANFMSAILDVPIASTADDSARSYVAYTERIPPIGTPVTLTLRPAAPAEPNAPEPPTAAAPTP